MTDCTIQGCDIDHAPRCVTPGCNRSVMVSSGGTRSTRCETCVRFHLTQAFAAPVPEWVRRSREGSLPFRIEGGVKA